MPRSLVSVLICLAAFAAPAAQAKPQPLTAYVGKVKPRIASYRATLSALDKVLSELPVTNVDPMVDELNTVADRLDRLDTRWLVVRAPKGLGVRHRGMGRAFAIQAEAWREYAAAVYTRDQDQVDAATYELERMLRSADYLQKRWAAALRGALVRAHLSLPTWLAQMTKP